jgi:feruloyl esterase
MFPRQAQYSGKGSVNETANWSCPPNQKLLQTGLDGIQAGLGHGAFGGKVGQENDG